MVDTLINPLMVLFSALNYKITFIVSKLTEFIFKLQNPIDQICDSLKRL